MSVPGTGTLSVRFLLDNALGINPACANGDNHSAVSVNGPLQAFSIAHIDLQHDEADEAGPVTALDGALGN